MSTILNLKIFKEVKELVSFSDVKVIKTLIDCSNIICTIHKMICRLWSLQDLYFIIILVKEVLEPIKNNDKTTQSRQYLFQILKTIVYIDSIINIKIAII